MQPSFCRVPLDPLQLNQIIWNAVPVSINGASEHQVLIDRKFMSTIYYSGWTRLFLANMGAFHAGSLKVGTEGEKGQPAHSWHCHTYMNFASLANLKEAGIWPESVATACFLDVCRVGDAAQKSVLSFDQRSLLHLYTQHSADETIGSKLTLLPHCMLTISPTSTYELN